LIYDKSFPVVIMYCSFETHGMSVSMDRTGKSMGLPSGSYWNQFYHLRFSLTVAVIAIVNGKEKRWEDGVAEIGF
jgi:hypothetical protein